MTLYQSGQMVLAAVACGFIAQRVRVLWFRAPLDAKPIVAKMEELIQRRAFDELRAFAAKLGDASWIGIVIRRAAQHAPKLDDVENAVDETLMDLKQEALKGLLTLRVLTSLATTAGLLGAVLELTRGATKDTSLASLEAGLFARLAFSNAMSSMALGIATAIVCGVSLRMFRRDAVKVFNEARAAGDKFCATLERN
ncbi:MAG: MotA/TolQ/ExbB proton channel family protein [Sandaracinaceae bacterium]|nr:MotA/TolQ/ExbB proton channel family protein [Sandaracinaceae bacterium]